MSKRWLEYRRNNAYDSILLVEGGAVIGAWDATEANRDYLAPGDLADWSPNWPDMTDPDDYGDLDLLGSGDTDGGES